MGLREGPQQLPNGAEGLAVTMGSLGVLHPPRSLCPPDSSEQQVRGGLPLPGYEIRVLPPAPRAPRFLFTVSPSPLAPQIWRCPGWMGG